MPPFFKKYIAAFLAFAAIFGVMTLKSFLSGEKPSSETLVIGLQSGYPPFEFMNDQGKIVGFDLDVAELIAKKLRKTLVVNDMEFEGEILSLKQGKIDLIISGMEINPTRLKEIAMVPYHGEAPSGFSLIFWKEIPEGIHSLEDMATLSNPTISVQSGATSETYLSKQKNIIAKSFQGALAPLMDVKYGKSAANLVEQDVAEYLKKKHPEIKTINIPITKEEASLGFGIGIKKENKILLQQIQQTIHNLKVSGELQKLEDKWFKGVN